MKRFLDDDFLLDTPARRSLRKATRGRSRSSTTTATCRRTRSRRTTASARPTEIWLEGDHYKWRAMRANGVARAPDHRRRVRLGEVRRPGPAPCPTRCATRSITGRTSSWRSPSACGQAARPGHRARDLRHCNRRLAETSFTTQGLLEQYRRGRGVQHRRSHRRLSSRTSATRATRAPRPSCSRPGARTRRWASTTSRPATSGSTSCEAASSLSIGSYDSFMEALDTRHDFFHEVGCRASDHGLDRIVAADYTAGEAQAIFGKARRGRRARPRRRPTSCARRCSTTSP